MTGEQAAEAIRALRDFARKMRAQAELPRCPSSLRHRTRIIADQATALADAYAEEAT